MKLVITLLLSLMLLDTPATTNTDDFVPKDIGKAVAIGCGIFGTKGAPAYVETQVFVKYKIDNGKMWDFEPILSRHDLLPDGVYRALHDCRDWLASVEKGIRQAPENKNDEHEQR